MAWLGWRVAVSNPRKPASLAQACWAAIKAAAMPYPRASGATPPIQELNTPRLRS